jgi:hypothetical protein
MNISNYPTGNRTQSLLSCGAAPEPTVHRPYYHKSVEKVQWDEKNRNISIYILYLLLKHQRPTSYLSKNLVLKQRIYFNTPACIISKLQDLNNLLISDALIERGGLLITIIFVRKTLLNDKVRHISAFLDSYYHTF